MTTQNVAVIRRLTESLSGRHVSSWNFIPGAAGRTQPGGAFRVAVPQISDSRLELTIDGAFVVVSLKQLIEVEGTWRIFQLEAP